MEEEPLTITRPLGAGSMSEPSSSSGVPPWVFAVTCMAVLLVLAIGYIAWLRWRKPKGRREARRRSTWYDRRRTEYYELERHPRREYEDERQRRRNGLAVPPRGGFGVKSGVSPISPGPSWARDFR